MVEDQAVGKLFKKVATVGGLMSGDIIAHHWGQGAFDSSRKGARGEFKNLSGQGRKMTEKQKREYRAREAAKSPETTITALTDRYS